MKILIISQYFWPENFRINELSEELCKLGHQITILTGYPNYPNGYIYPEFIKNKKKYESFKGAKIVRIPVIARKKNKFYLLLNYISFLINSLFIGYFKLRGQEFDIIFTFQVSPITIGITSAIFAYIKKCPQVFWVLDLWPDTLEALNIINKKWQLNLFKILVNWIYSRCDLILAQSKNILNEINSYSSVKNNTYYFPSWGESNLFIKQDKPAPEISKNELFTIMFAGNIGEAQDFPSLLKTVALLKSNNIYNFRIIIIGEGSKKEWLINEIKRLNLEKYFEIYKSYPFERMGSFFLHADVLLVNLLNRKVFNITIPGKIQFYLSSGIPIIGMICGEGAEVIRKAKAGIVCESGDYISFSKIISKIVNLDKERLEEMGINGKKYAKKEFSKTYLINKLNKFLNEIHLKQISGKVYR